MPCYLHPINTLAYGKCGCKLTWWRHWMETFSVLLTFCEENPSVISDVSSQRLVMRNFLLYAPEQRVEQTIETLVIWDAISLIMTSWEFITVMSGIVIFNISCRIAPERMPQDHYDDRLKWVFGNGLVPSGSKPLPESIVNKFDVGIWRHLSRNNLTILFYTISTGCIMLSNAFLYRTFRIPVWGKAKRRALWITEMLHGITQTSMHWHFVRHFYIEFVKHLRKRNLLISHNHSLALELPSNI